MPKISRHGGPTNAGVGSAPEPPEPTPVTAEDTAPTIAPEEEMAWPGNSSSASTETPPANSEPSESGPRKRARKTASRSSKDRTDTSSVPSTDGGLTEELSESDGTDADSTD
ncbi:hypothetical protein ABZ442_04890 [Streptomyces triculaminicus]|uniref:hypothetical protein n=1 Tax=Streptomyces triculaminicus TaxID=2816232 RepID=UPI0034106847